MPLWLRKQEERVRRRIRSGAEGKDDGVAGGRREGSGEVDNVDCSYFIPIRKSRRLGTTPGLNLSTHFSPCSFRSTAPLALHGGTNDYRSLRSGRRELTILAGNREMARFGSFHVIQDRFAIIAS